MNKRGFTLIELMVVISIISLLSSFIIASLSVARASARDAVRRTNLNQLETALELYYSDYGHYPETPRVLGAQCTGITPYDPNYCAYTSNTDPSNSAGRAYPTGEYKLYIRPTDNKWIPGLTPNYIASLPTEVDYAHGPNCLSNSTNSYVYYSDGQGYSLYLQCAMEKQLKLDFSDRFFDKAWYDYWYSVNTNSQLFRRWSICKGTFKTLYPKGLPGDTSPANLTYNPCAVAIIF